MHSHAARYEQVEILSRSYPRAQEAMQKWKAQATGSVKPKKCRLCGRTSDQENWRHRDEKTKVALGKQCRACCYAAARQPS